ncbi:hypothetical protein ACE3NQ_24810 [Paenibacillus terreus]|uniref:Uncharacterized protein n=1 Tax=Paenibacillus terreus TaxID=1387834 RepID=A0ABV5BEU6_9BACL
MPYDRRPDITDGNPQTEYEDTRPHMRTGFFPTQPDRTALPSEDDRSTQNPAPAHKEHK